MVTETINIEKFETDTGIELPTNKKSDLIKGLKYIQTMQDFAYNHPEMKTILEVKQRWEGNAHQQTIRDKVTAIN